MRCLKYASLFALLFVAACSNPYRHLTESRNTASVLRFRPEVKKELYRCVVDGRVVLKKFHLSGLLLFKTFDDHSTRAVFQNEMGFTFFDFKWDENDSFQVVSIIPQLDKPALVKLLEKDMNLLLMKRLNGATEAAFEQRGERYHRFTLPRGYAYYIEEDDRLKRIENAGKSKVITVELGRQDKAHTLPETILFRHHKANFTIDLKKITADA